MPSPLPPEDRRNSFQIMRLLAAALVWASHQAGMLGLQEPLIPGLDWAWGGLGVAIFFALSGYLIGRSLLRGATVGHFAASRVLRIFPGLLVALAACVIAGAVVSTTPIGAYLKHPQTHQFFFTNLLPFLGEQTYQLPGVFEYQYWPIVNGSLWTIKYELSCYLVLGAVVLLPARRRATVLTLLFGAVLAAHILWRWPLTAGLGDTYRFARFNLVDFAFFGLPFAFGAQLAALEHWRGRHVPLWPLVLLLAVAVALHEGEYLLPLKLCLAAGAALMLGRSKLAAWSWLDRHDLSYGLYLYAYPLSSLAVFLLYHHVPVWGVFVASGLSAVVLAALSWRLVESPALRLKTRLAAVRPKAGLTAFPAVSMKER